MKRQLSNMKKQLSFIAASLLLLNMVGCAMTPKTIVQAPLTARPQVPVATAPANGAIFQANAYRPMFEDRRARMVGDVLTIAISEKTDAAKTAGNSSSKTASTSYSAPQIFGLPASTVAKLGLSTATSNKLSETGAESAGNTFTGTITVTVTEVLPNGNLAVSGEKQVAFDNGSEFIRFSGVVNPDTIVNGNTVLSTQVADARVEYRTNSHVDPAEMMSRLSRFFMSMLPL
jgi:flagellar L-ring protein precursor FlgH